MINYNSPIINGMGNNNNFNGQMGNMVPFGNVGYNNNINYNNMGGYYNGMYNSFFNPYLAAEQQRIQEAQRKEHERQQAGIMKMLCKHVNNGLGLKEPSEEFLKRYDPVEERFQQDPEEEITYNLMQLPPPGVSYNTRSLQAIQACNQLYDNSKKKYPDKMGIKEFNEASGLIYAELLDEERKEKQRNLSTLYNSEDYNKILEKKGSTTYLNTFFGGGSTNSNVNLDDMEIKLPNNLKNEWEERRRKFMESIMKK